MPTEPSIKRVVAFVDGQNLYRSAKTAFGYHYPNYDVHAIREPVTISSPRKGSSMLIPLEERAGYGRIRGQHTRPAMNPPSLEKNTGTPRPRDARLTWKGVFDVIGLHQPWPRKRANHNLNSLLIAKSN